MKKTLFASLSVAALTLASCSSDEAVFAPGEGNGTITFSVTAPLAPQSRAIGEGDHADDLRVVIFDKDGNYLYTESHDNVFATTNKAEIPVRLVKGETYTIAFWVDKDNLYTIDGNGVLSMNYDGTIDANDDARDAFYAAHHITVKDENEVQNVTLIRPFAQINFGAEDYEKATVDLKKDFSQTSMTVTGDIFNQLNLCTGSVAGEPLKSVTFNTTKHPNEMLTADGKTVTWIGMNYILAEELGSTFTTVSLNIYDQNGNESYSHPLSFTSVPAKRNFRTNIIGNLVTNTSNWTIVVDANMYQPLTPSASGVYELNTIGDLQQISTIIAKNKHGEGNPLKFNLKADIDLGGAAWEPINSHWVEIDGEGHTLSNFNCGYNEYGKSGFISYLGGGTIKNITLKNVTAKGAQAGIVAGQTDGGHIENVTIEGENTVTYYDIPSYKEEWCGVGALVGVVNTNNLSGITIADGAVINVVSNGISSKVATRDIYAFYVAGNSNTNVTNNGKVLIDGAEGNPNAMYVSIPADDSAQAAFTAALNSANDDKPVNITLPEGKTFTLSSSPKGDVTIKGAGPSSVVDMAGKSLTAKNISFEDVTMVRSYASYSGFQHTSSETYKNCSIQGTLWTYAGNMSFENCDFTCDNDNYAVWCYGGGSTAATSTKIKFDNCRFTGENKAILIYNEGTSYFDVTVDDCTFTATQDQDPAHKDNKCAIQMHTELGTTGTLTINKSSQTGFADFNGGLWREVKNNPKPATPSKAFVITVDGKVIETRE